MPSNVFVALWSNNNVASRSWTTTITARVHRLDRRLELAQQWINSRAAQLNTNLPYQGIFLAPEYLFTKQSATNERNPMSESRRLRLEQSFLGLSRKYPKILIVPGTVFYAKRLMRSRQMANKFDPATGQRTLPKVTDRDRRDRSLAQVRTYIGQMQAPRFANDGTMHFWAHTGYDAGGNDVPSLKEIREALRDPTKQPYIVKNAAYMLLGGKRLAKFDKQSDYGETVGASPDDFAFLPGVFKQCPEIGGYRFGAEVCFDHANALLARRQVTPLHFHMVVSDWAETTAGNMAMSNGGYFAHASTNYAESCVWRRTDLGATEDITANLAYYMETGGSTGSKLDGYVLPLPTPMVPPRR